MIRTLYRRPDAPTTPANAFVEVPATDPLEGAVPTWRIAVEDDPAWQETIALLGFDPTAVKVSVEVVEGWGVPGPDAPTSGEPRTTPLENAPTPALQLVPALDAPDDVDEVLVVECPDCGAIGLDPCRPKGNPATGKPLTRQHRRRRELLEREAGRGGVLLMLVVVLLVLAVAGGVGGFLASVTDDVRRPLCVVPTAAGCEVGP